MPALLIRTAARRFSHLKFHAERQLRMNPAGAVGLPGRDVDFADQTGEPQMRIWVADNGRFLYP